MVFLCGVLVVLEVHLQFCICSGKSHKFGEVRKQFES